MIKLKGVSRYFFEGRSNEVRALSGVDLELPTKGMVAIFGRSGCGKTTMLNVIGGLDKATEGRVEIDGKQLTPDADALRNTSVGYIFQNYNLNKNESCYDNVADALRLLGVKDKAVLDKRVEIALKAVGMEKYSKRLPDTLSGGQQQRVAIARAIVKRPAIILADEPTGNLDEANTVMIMELLRAVAEEHLVLLVTHEEKLVDLYCDEVIELKDGRVEGRRKCDTGAIGAYNDKNTVYLGELKREMIEQGDFSLEYFGSEEREPLRLRLIEHKGQLYLDSGGASIRILDRTCELSVKEGQREMTSASEHTVIDLSALPPVNAKKPGHLFGFFGAIKSGCKALFGKQKRGKKILTGSLLLFGFAFVYAVAVLGVALGNLIDTKKNYNHNAFYVLTPDFEVGQKLLDAVGKDDTGIEYTYLLPYHYERSDVSFSFYSGFFETFTETYYSAGLNSKGILLPEEMMEDLPLVCGSKDIGSASEAVVTTAFADKILESSAYEYINDYDDVVGLIARSDGMRIVGVVSSRESVVYVSELSLASRHSSYADGYYRGASFGLDVKEGEVVLALTEDALDQPHPVVGDKIKVHGIEFAVSSVIIDARSYSTYLKGMGIQKSSPEEFFRARAISENPQLDPADPTDSAMLDQLAINYIESSELRGYFEYYFEQRTEYLSTLRFFHPSDITAWLALEKGVTSASCESGEYYNLYYYGLENEKTEGNFPGLTELRKMDSSSDDMDLELYRFYGMYSDEFYQNQSDTGIYFSSTKAVLLSDKDYAAAIRGYGQTDLAPANKLYFGDIVTLVYSSDPEKTAAWIAENISVEASDNDEYNYPAIMTPDDVYHYLVTDTLSDMTAGVIALAVFVAVMGLCMYFIMRSAMMSRIKEIGIYRAIGVCRRNLVFRFLVESGVLVVRKVLPGYLIATGMIIFASVISPLISEMLFYPWWFAILTLAVMAAICLITGIIPILALLRKTPSQILAKYDI